jgi:hypothetical protein
MTKEKLSTKSLVTSSQYIGAEPLISDTKVEKKLGMGPNKSVFKSLKDDDAKPKNKYAARFTIVNATAGGMDIKQGVILEDQNESSDNSSDETDSDKSSLSDLKSEKSISSLHSSDPSREMLTMNFGKSNSLQVDMKKRIFKNNNDDSVISSDLDGLVKKDDIHQPNKNKMLNIAEQYGESSSVIDQIFDENRFKKSQSSSNRFVPRSVQSQTSFITDLSVLKNKNNGEKTKGVLSRLRMMI